MSAEKLLHAAQTLRETLRPLRFAAPVEFVYQPLDYAWAPHAAYLTRFGAGRKKVVFVGMNPGPFGMTQTGVPFGEIAAVRDWMQIREPVGKPEREHPKRPVLGFDCPQSEVSGRRLWGHFAARFGAAENFFAEHFVANFCPLVFIEAGGKNFTPDKLPAAEAAALNVPCDAHLRAVIAALEPEWVIGVGAYAEECAVRAKETMNGGFKTGRVLHPSPASPAANRDWAGAATKQLEKLGVW
ncbi:MAG: single-stranded DNA-binding protein [Verrucomicrobiaceae bacterium]|nr:single-stranded DNA-binding protein [Verrucomicrobiaceae bacterium]